MIGGLRSGHSVVRPEWLPRLLPPILDVALDVAEQAERELSDQPGLQSSTEDACQD